MARQLLADLYRCDSAILDDEAALTKAAHEAISALGAVVVEERCHQFDPIGISYIAVISTSHFSIHTWPEYGYAAVDAFSCTDEMPDKIISQLKDAFGSDDARVEIFERQIGNEG